MLTVDGELDGLTNMARDAGLLEIAEAGEVAARVYGWDGPWVTLGRFQNPERDLLRDSGVPFALRPTGGKAVLHGHDVTVALALPLERLEDSRSVKTAYRAAVEPIILALRRCGLPAGLAENTRFGNSGPRVADCFAHVSPNDVVDERSGMKVCGCALKLSPSAVLVQASIPAGRPLVDPRTVIVGGKALVATQWDSASFAQAFGEALERTWRETALV